MRLWKKSYSPSEKNAIQLQETVYLRREKSD